MAELNIFARFETKFMVNYEQRKAVEREMAKRMVPDPHGQSTICNIYYDTPDYRLIRRSLEKPVYKEKLRVRSYGQVGASDDVFLELKKKYKGIVYKRRIELSENLASAYLASKVGDGGGLWLSSWRDQQIAKEIDYFRGFYEGLAPRVYLCYDRCAYFSTEDPSLRITFDRNIRWRNKDLSLTAAPGGIDLLDKGHSLMEIKTSTGLPMWLVKVLNAERINKAHFSKYGKAYESMMLYAQTFGGELGGGAVASGELGGGAVASGELGGGAVASGDETNIERSGGRIVLADGSRASELDGNRVRDLDRNGISKHDRKDYYDGNFIC